MSVEKLPEGRGYKVRWRDSAGNSRRKTVRLWRDAVALDGEMKRKRAMGELIAHEKGKITLNDFWEVWWRQYAMSNLSPRSRENYSTLWRRHIKPALGSSSLARLDRESVTSWSASLSGTMASSSVRKAVAVLQCVLARALEWSYIPANPAAGIKKPRLVQRRGRALTLEQVEALVLELPDLRSQTIVRVLSGTGIRPGELRALDWYAIGDVLTVERAASQDEIGPTKTNGRRTVLISHSVARALKEWMFACRHEWDHELVFPGRDGRLWTDQGWKMWQRKVFRPAAERAGLAGLVPYDLRHTYASQRIAEGADILTLARSLGHSPTMTLTVYGHLLNHGGSDAELGLGSHSGSDRRRPGGSGGAAGLGTGV